MGRVEYLGGIVYIINLGLLGSKMVILLVSIEVTYRLEPFEWKEECCSLRRNRFFGSSHNYVTQLLAISLEIPSRDEQGFWGDVDCFFFLE